MMTALSGMELLAWVEQTSTGWRALVCEHPEMLSQPCDVRETSSVAGLLQHIVAVELRYAQRLNGMKESSYDEIGFSSGEELYSTHDRAMELLRVVLGRDEFQWEENIEFTTRNSGTMRASRRVILVHLLMHSIRHYAQLATLVRHHGIVPNWPMDYLFMGMQPA
jgi:uncharacterized damage-inducible protein DinB